MKNGTRNEKVVFDIIFNLICMIYIIYSWMSITNVGVVTALTHNNGDAMILIFGAAIVLIVFFIIDIISLILGKKQKGYLLPGYVGVSIGVKCIAILFLVLAYILKLKIPPTGAFFQTHSATKNLPLVSSLVYFDMSKIRPAIYSYS